MKNYNLIDQLYILVKLIDKNKLDNFRLFEENSESKISILYKLIKSGYSPIEIREKLNYTKNDLIAYERLQRRLLKKLKAALFFLNTRNKIFSNLGLEFYQLLKSTFYHRILILLNKRMLSYESIEKDYRRSIKYEFPELSLQIATQLRDYYGYIQPNQKKFKYYDNEITKQKNKYDLDLIISKHYAVISYQYIYKKDSTENIIRLINNFKKDIRDFEEENFTHKTKIQYFDLIALNFQLTFNYDELIKLCKDTLQFFNEKNYRSHLFEYMIKGELVNAYINTNKLDKALNSIYDIRDLFENSNSNWYKIKSLEYYIWILKNNYDKAYEIITTCTTLNKSKVYSSIQETWKIKEAYFHFLTELGVISEEVLQKYPMKSFRLNRFLNDVPVFSKEKRGLNVSILIIQMLIYLQQKKFNKFIDRMDALKQYSYRYLRNDESLRSNCFIKMLLKIPDAYYHPAAVQRHVKKYYDRMIAAPAPISDQTTNVEVIPYEKLWEFTLELLVKIKK